MCGLAAVVDYRGTGATGRIVEMTDIVRHRGPDGEGYALFDGHDLAPAAFGGIDTPAQVWNSDLRFSPKDRIAPASVTLALGHRRLSIIDLSAGGHQPMCTADGRLWIVYNGEIYNHVELRAELGRLGHRFESSSDTEVILAAWQRWGKACLERFNGMFAFILVDRSRAELVAVRDRFGVKPLYWWQSPLGFVALASEIKQFATLPGWVPRIDPQMAYDYLAWGTFDHSSRTLFADVRQLRGGEMMVLPLRQPPALVHPERWYELAPQPFEGDWDSAAGIFRDIFTDAVRLRLRSDVPVGSCLSGGLDSSAIVCVANRLLSDSNSPGAHKTFSAASDVARYDERRFAEIVIAATGVEGHFVYPHAEGALDALDRLTWHQDEPFGSSSIYAQWQVFASAAENDVKVMLDGQGADELLAGYTGFLRSRLDELARSARPVALLREIMAAGAHPVFGFVYTLQQLANALLPDAPKYLLRRAAGRASTRPDWLDVERLGARDREPCSDERDAYPGIAGLSHRLLLHTGVPMLLHTEDRNSMAHSVESRVPYLDYRLVERVLGMPDDYKLALGETKRVLRAAMRGVLPEAIRTRTDKLGFVTAEQVWMQGPARARFRAGVEQCIAASCGIVRPSALTDFDAVVEGRRTFDFRAWRLLNFGAWMRRFGLAFH